MDSVTARATPQRNPRVAWVEIDAEVVLYDAESGQAHLLSETGSLLWPWLDGSATVGELAADVADVFDVAPDVAQEQVEAFVAQLTEAGLLVDVQE